MQPSKKRSLLNTLVDLIVTDYTETVFICHNNGLATLEFYSKRAKISGKFACILTGVVSGEGKDVAIRYYPLPSKNGD